MEPWTGKRIGAILLLMAAGAGGLLDVWCGEHPGHFYNTKEDTCFAWLDVQVSWSQLWLLALATDVGRRKGMEMAGEKPGTCARRRVGAGCGVGWPGWTERSPTPNSIAGRLGPGEPAWIPRSTPGSPCGRPTVPAPPPYPI